MQIFWHAFASPECAAEGRSRLTKQGSVSGVLASDIIAWIIASVFAGQLLERERAALLSDGDGDGDGEGEGEGDI